MKECARGVGNSEAKCASGDDMDLVKIHVASFHLCQSANEGLRCLLLARGTSSLDGR